MKKGTQMHSAEWCRGAVAALGRMVDECQTVFDSDLPHITEGNLEDYLAEYSQQLAEAEAREAVEPALAEQLAAAQGRIADLQNERDAAVYVMELEGHATDHGRHLLAARDARMKALGAAEALRTLNARIDAKRNTMLATFGSYTATDAQAVIREELQVLAEAARLAEGE